MVEHVRGAVLPRAIADVFGDLAELVQREVRLARAELSDKLSTKVRAVVWLAGAAFLVFFAILFGLAGLALGLSAAFGLALHWSCLIVAAGLLVLAVLIFLLAWSDAREDITPSRTLQQIQKDFAAVKEQLS